VSDFWHLLFTHPAQALFLLLPAAQCPAPPDVHTFLTGAPNSAALLSLPQLSCWKAVCSCPRAHRKLSGSLILMQLLENTTEMSPALPLLCGHQASLLKTAQLRGLLALRHQ